MTLHIAPRFESRNSRINAEFQGQLEGARYLEIQNMQGGSSASRTPGAAAETTWRDVVKLKNPSRSYVLSVTQDNGRKNHFYFIKANQPSLSAGCIGE